MKNFWEDNGDEWVKILDEKRIASRSATNSAILQEIQKLSPKSVLDIGCGEGWLARALPENLRYLGLDGSRSLIESADKKSTKEFLVASYEDITSGKWTSDQYFDVVVYNFSLLDQEISHILRESSKLLTENGRLLIQTLHPFSSGSQYENRWNEDDFSSVSSQIVGKMPWYQRTLSGWSEIFSDSGLVIASISEPVFEGKSASIIFVLSKK